MPKATHQLIVEYLYDESVKELVKPIIEETNQRMCFMLKCKIFGIQINFRWQLFKSTEKKAVFLTRCPYEDELFLIVANTVLSNVFNETNKMLVTRGLDTESTLLVSHEIIDVKPK